MAGISRANASPCHPRDARNVGIPVINGWPADQFVAVLKSYKARERDNPVTQSVAAGLSDEEMAALAAYFETLKPGRLSGASHRNCRPPARRQ